MPKSKAGAPAETVALYEALVATQPGVELKGATQPYTSLNGHMFSVLFKDGTLGLRLPKGDREAFLTAYDTKLCEQYGSVLPEYVEVPAALLAKTDELRAHFERSHAYVRSLKPSPPAKSRKKAPASPAS